MARLTFSYGTNETQLRRATELRLHADEHNPKLKICGELEGQRLRIGTISNDGIEDDIIVDRGSNYVFRDAASVDKAVQRNCIPVPGLAEQKLDVGEHIVYGDTGSEFVVVSNSGDDVVVRSLNSDLVVGTRSILIANRPLPAFKFDERSTSQANFIIDSDTFDYLVLPSVLNQEVVMEARQMIQESGQHVGLIAKLGFPIDRSIIAQICDVSDYVVLDRSDCALVHGASYVPVIIAEICSHVPQADSKLVVSSQIASSMSQSGANKLAFSEISDIWNFVKLGVAGLMLAEETAVNANGVLALEQTSSLLTAFNNTTFGSRALITHRR